MALTCFKMYPTWTRLDLQTLTTLFSPNALVHLKNLHVIALL